MAALQEALAAAGQHLRRQEGKQVRQLHPLGLVHATGFNDISHHFNQLAVSTWVGVVHTAMCCPAQVTQLQEALGAAKSAAAATASMRQQQQQQQSQQQQQQDEVRRLCCCSCASACLFKKQHTKPHLPVCHMC